MFQSFVLLALSVIPLYIDNQESNGLFSSLTPPPLQFGEYRSSYDHSLFLETTSRSNT